MFLSKTLTYPQILTAIKEVDRHSSLFIQSVSDEVKKFYNTDTWCHFYKTFFFITDAVAKIS
jgi:hypothetical protein